MKSLTTGGLVSKARIMKSAESSALMVPEVVPNSYIHQQQQHQQQQPGSSASSYSTSSYCYYQETVEEGLDCCFYKEGESSAASDDLFQVPKYEGSADSNAMESPVPDAFADVLIGFDSGGGQVPTYEPQVVEDWEALVGGVLDNSADSHSGIDEEFLLIPNNAEEDQDHVEDDEAGKSPGLELVDLLVACAEAVSAKSVSLVHCLLARLGELASPEGPTTMERVAAYFTEGLACRVANERPDVYKPLLLETDPSLGSACSSEAEEEAVAAFHILNHVSPIVKFAHFSANDAILQAFAGRDKVHVIDLEVGQGLQWPALFQGLASRSEGPPSLVKITGIGPFKDSIEETGERLGDFAQSLGLSFEFHPVVERLDDIRLWMLHVKEGEAVAVNCIGQLHRSMQSREQIEGVLEMIRSSKPVVVALVEQEASHNAPSFEARFAGSLKYYAAVFDALDSSLLNRRSSVARSKVERTIFAREIRNIVGCEGEERIERHERFGEWRKLMDGAGFKNKGMGKRALVQAKLLLQMFSCKDYGVEEADDDDADDGGGRITLSWLDQPLLTVSAWTL